MRTLVSISLLIASCSTMSNSPTQAPEQNTSGTTHIIGHTQDANVSILPDSTKNSYYPTLMVDPCGAFNSASYCNSVLNSRVDSFIKNNVKDNAVVLLSSVGYNYRPIRNDIGGYKQHLTIDVFPFLYKTTEYTGSDSSTLSIDSIGKNSVFIKIEQRYAEILTGDTLVQKDTLYSRIDSSYCWQQIIITQNIINYGKEQLKDERFKPYF